MDRLAPDSGNVSVTNTPTVNANLQFDDSELTATGSDGRLGLDTVDTDVRRLLEEILLIQSDTNDLIRKLVGG